MRDQVLSGVIGGITSGIFFRSFFVLTYSVVGFVCVLGFSCIVLSGMRRVNMGRMVLTSVFLFAFALGVLRYDVAERGGGESTLSMYLEQKVTMVGVVADEPDQREGSTRVSIRPLAVEGADVSGQSRVLVSYPHFPRLRYGDKVQASGVLARPENFETDTGREFNYVAYLKKDGIEYQMSFATVERMGEGEGNVILSTLFLMKRLYLESIAQTIPEPEVSLLGGITIGAKESLGSTLMDVFRRVGLVHLVVLSGYNISIVAESIMVALRVGGVVPRGVSLGVGAVSIILFALMTGGSATVVRASLMALLVVLARATGRTYDLTKALCIAGVAMVLHSPYILAFDPSFQLSFVATLGLILLGPHLERFFTCIPARYGFREFAVATIATQIFVLPLLLYQNGTLSLVSVPANLLVLAVVPLAMLLGFLAGIAGLISIYLAYPFALGAYILLTYILFIANLLSQIPFATVTIPYVSVWAVVFMYAALTLWVIRLHGVRA